MKTWWMSRETRKVEPTELARDEGNCRTFDREAATEQWNEGGKYDLQYCTRRSANFFSGAG